MDIAKSIGWFMTVIALTVLVAACSGGDTPPEPGTPSETVDAPQVTLPAMAAEPAQPQQGNGDLVPPEIAERLAREARIQMQTQRDQLGKILKQYEPIVEQGFTELEKQAAALSEDGLEAYEPAREKLLEAMEQFRAVAEKINDPAIESGNELLDELKLAVKDFRSALRDALAVLDSETGGDEPADESTGETGGATAEAGAE